MLVIVAHSPFFLCSISRLPRCSSSLLAILFDFWTVSNRLCSQHILNKIPSYLLPVQLCKIFARTLLFSSNVYMGVPGDQEENKDSESIELSVISGRFCISNRLWCCGSMDHILSSQIFFFWASWMIEFFIKIRIFYNLQELDLLPIWNPMAG